MNLLKANFACGVVCDVIICDKFCRNRLGVLELWGSAGGPPIDLARRPYNRAALCAT